jgi:hypothetical protein
MGLFANSEKEMHIPSCNYSLKEHLGEPAQFKTRFQFGRARQLVKTKLWLSFKHNELGHGKICYHCGECLSGPEWPCLGKVVLQVQNM